MVRCLALALATASLSALQVAAQASLTIYRDEQSFLAAAPIVSIETFDQYPSSTPFYTQTVCFSGVSFYVEPDPLDQIPRWWSIMSWLNTPSPPNRLMASRIEPQTITFGQNRYVYAFGFSFSRAALQQKPYDFAICETNGSVTQFRFAEPSEAGLTPFYFGFLSTAGISRVTIADAPLNDGATNWTYDNVARSLIIPEPASLPVVLGGLGLLGFAARRRRT